MTDELYEARDGFAKEDRAVNRVHCYDLLIARRCEVSNGMAVQNWTSSGNK